MAEQNGTTVVVEEGTTASLVLSYRMERGTPPKNATAALWPSQNASVVSAG